jgi:hypothetical protein
MARHAVVGDGLPVRKVLGFAAVAACDSLMADTMKQVLPEQLHSRHPIGIFGEVQRVLVAEQNGACHARATSVRQSSNGNIEILKALNRHCINS